MTDKEWLNHFKNQKQQSLSVCAYQKANSISSASWYYHRKRLADRPGFVPVKISPTKMDSRIEISIESSSQDGCKLIVYSKEMAILTSFLTAGLNEAS